MSLGNQESSVITTNQDESDIQLEQTQTPVEPEMEKYSFSKLSSWWTCPYGYKLRYIDKKKGIDNAFSSYGTLVHSIMERYAKKILPLSTLLEIYDWEFDTAIPEKFPPNKYVDLRKRYYEQGVEFLINFQGYDQYEILGVEQEFEHVINDWKLVGVIDLLFRDENGNLIIRDYKSKAKFKNKAEQAQYARQLYLYSLYVKDKYGKYPDKLQFLMFRNQNLVEFPFCEKDLEEAVNWAQNTVDITRRAFDYPPTCEDFYGNHLCNHREYCPFKIKQQYSYRKKK